MKQERVKGPLDNFTAREAEHIELNQRYQKLCRMTDWDIEVRDIGRALIVHGAEGWSVSALANYLQLARMTTQRRLDVLVCAGLAEVKDNGLYYSTESGTRLHIMVHRAFIALACGARVGLPEELLDVMHEIQGRLIEGHFTCRNFVGRKELEEISFHPPLDYERFK